MGVYIKGVEMPKGDELLCINVYPDGKVCINLDLDCKQIATAVPVQKHGVLIDRDALLSQYGGMILTAEVDYAEGIRDVIKDIQNAPTIIEAEEGE